MLKVECPEIVTRRSFSKFTVKHLAEYLGLLSMKPASTLKKDFDTGVFL